MDTRHQNKSAPIILVVKNISGHDLENIELFDALDRGWDPRIEAGSFKTDEFIIEMAYKKPTYKHVVRAIAVGDAFTFMQVMCQFKLNTEGFALTICTHDSSGRVTGIQISARPGAEQLRKNISLCKEGFSLDKCTSVVLHKLLAKDEVNILFYPSLTERSVPTYIPMPFTDDLPVQPIINRCQDENPPL